MVYSNIDITRQDLAEIAGAASIGDVAPDQLERLQQDALSAMGASDVVITREAMAELAGVDALDTAAPDVAERLQRQALSAMADSDTGITVERLAALEGVPAFEDLAHERLAYLHPRSAGHGLRTARPRGQPDPG